MKLEISKYVFCLYNVRQVCNLGKNAVEDMNKMNNEDCIDKQKTIKHIQDLVNLCSRSIESDSTCF